MSHYFSASVPQCLSASVSQCLILGLGNPILTDDAVGLRVVEAVQAAIISCPLPHPVIASMSVGGLALMEALVGYERVILIDALWHPGWSAGTIQRLTLEDLATWHPTVRSVSPHDTSLSVALHLGREMGLDLPKTIIMYAVGVTNIRDFGAEPTPAVAAAIPTVVAAILAELATWAKPALNRDSSQAL